MTLPGRIVAAYASAYARHVGLEADGVEAEVERRLERMEPWVRAYAALSAWLILHAAPALLLGRAVGFERLGPGDKELLLGRLLRRGPLLRALFLGARSLALSSCYGRPRR